MTSSFSNFLHAFSSIQLGGQGEGMLPSPESPYPQPWVQVKSSVEQLIIIIIFVLPLADKLMDSGSEANESWGAEESQTPFKTPGVPLSLQPSKYLEHTRTHAHPTPVVEGT